MPSPLVYKNGVRPEQAKDVEVIYLILGEMKYDEDCDPEKVWEIIDEGSSNLRILFDWLKNNYEWLDLDNTNIYVTEKSKEKERGRRHTLERRDLPLKLVNLGLARLRLFWRCALQLQTTVSEVVLQLLDDTALPIVQNATRERLTGAQENDKAQRHESRDNQA